MSVGHSRRTSRSPSGRRVGEQLLKLALDALLLERRGLAHVVRHVREHLGDPDLDADPRAPFLRTTIRPGSSSITRRRRHPVLRLVARRCRHAPSPTRPTSASAAEAPPAGRWTGGRCSEPRSVATMRRTVFNLTVPRTGERRHSGRGVAGLHRRMRVHRAKPRGASAAAAGRRGRALRALPPPFTPTSSAAADARAPPAPAAITRRPRPQAAVLAPRPRATACSSIERRRPPRASTASSATGIGSANATCTRRGTGKPAEEELLGAA